MAEIDAAGRILLPDVRFCWTFNSIPELSHLSREERRAIIRRSMSWPQRIRMIGRPLALALITLLLYAAAVLLVVGPTPSRSAGIIVRLGGVAWWLAVAAIFYQLQFRSIRRIIRDQVIADLRGRRLPACLSCHFDLRGTIADKCPECGAPTAIPSESPRH